jgi:hypothetical protein
MFNNFNNLDGNRMIVSWFSAGVSSAVGTKIYIIEPMYPEIDKIIYIDIDDQHPDSMRFVKDCEQWFGKEISILSSPYKSVENACLSAGGKGYINGAHGAACSLRLKKKIRIQWEYEQNYDDKITYIWGLDCLETVIKSMPDQNHIFPLIDKNITKSQAHEILKASGIKRPQMYDLGYHNNNCIGCVKGGKGYWNKIRVDFPDVFQKRAEMERKIGKTCLKKDRPDKNLPASKDNSVNLFLDELNPKSGNHKREIMEDCGMFCDSMRLE